MTHLLNLLSPPFGFLFNLFFNLLDNRIGVVGALTAALIATPVWAQGAADDGGLGFGDNASRWANNGVCDDPCFESARRGHGMADVVLWAHRGHDANDCRALFRKELIRRRDDNRCHAVDGSRGRPIEQCDSVQFGDDSQAWANDGECNDPRFASRRSDGRGMAQMLYPSDAARDASDCSALCESGVIGFAPFQDDDGVDFGDNTSHWANDGECDDPRFENAPHVGYGMAAQVIPEDARKDANDCRMLYGLGAIQLRR